MEHQEYLNIHIPENHGDEYQNWHTNRTSQCLNYLVLCFIFKGVRDQIEAVRDNEIEFEFNTK
jgi:hypothetical protein